MAPSRGKGKAKASAARDPVLKAAPRTRRSAGNARKNGVPDVYHDMLAEASATDTAGETSDRPLKRRRLVRSVSVPKVQSAGDELQRETDGDVEATSANARGDLQTVEDSSASDDDDEDESDFGFEDVDLDQAPSATEQEDGDDIADVSISINPTTTPKRAAQVRRRKPASVAEKAHRLVVHKAHILCLLGHCIYINSWCNNAVVQRHLRPLLSKKTVSYLNPKTDDSQFNRDRVFREGLQQASEAFRGAFRVCASGMRRARWAAESEDGAGRLQDETEPMDRADFIAAAKRLEGSQDCGNQLFCALLRAVGVETRLVCSLQPLPFANAPNKSTTPQKNTKTVVYATASGTDPAASDSNTDDTAISTSKRIGKVPSVRRRLGQPTFTPDPISAPPPPKKKPIRKLAYPVFWTEAFNAAHQKWLPLDPLVTQTVNKPSKFEPPSSYDLNQMSYVIAFETNGVARDVTKRYTKAFNAKTRRLRVESTESGTVWLKKALRLFRRRAHLASQAEIDRDQVEDAELAQREAREGLPGNVLDFKGHPYYALERHLRRHEVIQPRREVGKVNAGTAAKPRMESVYRRQDVLACRSADRWFRVGREILRGEQGIKIVRARRAVRRDGEGSGEEEARETSALYALFQTQLYVPPPVVDGRVPRNAFGNLDLYVPSMIPAGGTHIRHPLARDAARRILNVDFVDAVTGFSFKGRQGTAVVEGGIVAEEFAEAVWAVIETMEDGRVEEESRARSALALRMWRRLLTGLRIQERVSRYGDGNTVEEDARREVGGEADEAEQAGGFMPAEGDEEEVLPTAGRYSLEQLAMPTRSAARQSKRKVLRDESEAEAESSDNNDDDHVGDVEKEYETSSRSKRSSRRRVVDDESEDDYVLGNEGGTGFLPEHATGDEGGGGFVPEDVDMADDAKEHGGTRGFIVEQEDLEDRDGGGFVPEDTEMTVHDEEKEDEGREQDLVTELEQDLRNDIAEPVPTEMSRAPLHTDDDGATTPEDTSNTQLADVHVASPPSNDRNANAATTANKSQDPADAPNVPADESDRGSMLSHDPEDEDAEPDWLESD